MAEQIIWLDGKATVGIEKICPGRHVKQNEWKPEWNEKYRALCYDYISDYECIFNHPIDHWGNKYLREDDRERWQNLQAAKNQGTTVPITNLAHFTDLAAAKQICNTKGFKGVQKKINEERNGNRVTNITARLSWWSPIFTLQDASHVRNHLGTAIQPFLEEEEEEDNLLDTLKSQFATSDAFLPNPYRYGSTLFQYGINELCQYYSRNVHDEVQYKILGTYGYKKEVMHAVLVCSQADGAEQFAAYPDVPAEDNAAVIIRDKKGNWVWKPQATGGDEIVRLQAHWQNYPMYRRWENVAFAFHLPDDMIMKCDRAPDQPADHRKIITEDGTIVDYQSEDDSEEDDEL